jgi:hypothetical protein
MTGLKGAWEQLAKHYACPLDEDDIIDLREGKILKDRGVVRGLDGQVSFGGIFRGTPILDEVGGAHTKDEDDFDELDSISHEARVLERLEAQLRRVKPLRDVDERDLQGRLKTQTLINSHQRALDRRELREVDHGSELK